MKSSVTERCRKIRCLLLDVDGVLTDGKLHFTSQGDEFKTFDVQDGHGIAMAQRAGLMIGFISGRPSKATARRAADLRVNIVMQKSANKMEMVEQIKRRHGLTNAEIAFVGDELVDLPVLRRVGLAVAVPNAVGEVKRTAHYVTRRRGGDGAVREVIEMILKARGLWKNAVAKYMVLVAALLWVLPHAVSAGDRMVAQASVPVETNHSQAGTPTLPKNDTASGYIEKFEVPERDENGNLKWKLDGDRAEIRPDGLMNIQNAKAQFYTSNKVDMVFTSPTCLLDRVNNHATTDDHVRIDRENMVVTGIGGEWDGNKSSIVIRSNVCVVIRGTKSMFGEQPKQP
ncbi:MAG TPA: HAD-IIIA family hydrolase [Verrucomicrobiae bacterium]|nr:HAD-IIIA family hydrolase [Verrucomicrobiae bacterium]